MRSLLALGFIAFTGITFSARPASAAETIIGYVNLQRAILETEEGKRAQARLKKTVDKKQAALSKQEDALRKEKEKLDKELAVSNSETSRAKGAQFQAKIVQLQQDFMKQQQELQSLQRTEFEGIAKKMRTIIGQIGKSNNYTLILEITGNRLLYGKPHLDLTNEVIRKYNQAHK